MSAYERMMYREAELRRIESQIRTEFWLDVIVPLLLVLLVWGVYIPLMFVVGPVGFALLPMPVLFTLLIGEVLT